MRTIIIEPSKMYYGDLILVNSTHPFQKKKETSTQTKVRREFPFIKWYKRAGKKLLELLEAWNGKERITNVAEEPQHVCCVGYPHARIIEEMRVTVEEYIEFLKQFTQDGKHYIYTVGKEVYEIYCVQGNGDEPIKLQLPSDVRCQISGNNDKAIIVTLW